MIEYYIQLVTQYPLTTAAIQFGILGTIGEYISYYIKTKKFSGFGNISDILLKIIGWALLGIIIKYGFTGMRGFVQELLEHNLLPGIFSSGVLLAFAISVFTNILFGPQMMAFHRFYENLIERKKGFQGIQKAWLTLIWFWIPAHTVTFSLPKEYQIGLAAVWSLVLGIIMGITHPQKQ